MRNKETSSIIAFCKGLFMLFVKQHFKQIICFILSTPHLPTLKHFKKMSVIKEDWIYLRIKSYHSIKVEVIYLTISNDFCYKEILIPSDVLPYSFDLL